MKPLRPRALARGSRIALVSPSSSFDHARWSAGESAIRAFGYEPVPMPNSMKAEPQYFAGTVEQRLADIHAAFGDPSIDAILCNRGGYGSNMLLPGLDLDLIRANAKAFIGHSDVTSLMTWMQRETGLVTFHGPLLAGDFSRENGVDAASWESALQRTAPWQLDAASGLTILKSGAARGTLSGGCLPMLAASLGTPYEVETRDSILFLEDVNTRPYQIDRMLVQLRYAGKFDGVRGVIFGAMMDCVSPGASPTLLWDVLRRFFKDFDGPVVYGLRSGHVRSANITVPLGVNVELDAQREPILRFPESAVEER
jgi:muramoyltetrapeptide carboxypeptidase